MNRHFGVAAFAVGLAAVGWVGYGYLGSNPLALTMTALIAAFYLTGAVELHRFRQATASLTTALQALPEPAPPLDGWLATLHPSLRHAVRLRIEGERVALPGPAMTPYLVGLLVLLGMLGTFVGMVVTLNGAVMALESTTELATMRAALAAPVKGLGLAFGTSVAGVAASAALGLVSALCRRERLQASQALDARIATTLRAHSLAHQREQTLETLQAQARVMPEMVDKLEAMMAQMQRHHETLNERLLASQDRFHAHAQSAYTDLATSVDRSLQRSLTDSARAAGETIQPVVESTMAGLARETAAFHQRLADTVQAQLDGLATRFDSTVTTVAGTWTDALAQHERTSATHATTLQATLTTLLQTLERQSASLLASLDRAHAELRADIASADGQRQAAFTESLASMATSLQLEWQQAGARSVDQHAQVCKTLEQTAHDIHARAERHARDTIAEMTRLIDTALEAPRAAAEVVGKLREELSNSMARDNALLEERGRILETMGTLLDTVNQAATEQRAAVDAMVASSSTTLAQTTEQFGRTIAHHSTQIDAVAAQVTASAAEVASLGDALAVAVQTFADTSQALTGHLERIEAALAKSTARSDEQLAYYVAQAREIVDLSISSQKQIVEDLQQLAIRQPAGAVA